VPARHRTDVERGGSADPECGCSDETLLSEGAPVESFWFGNDLPPVWVPLDGPIAMLADLALREADLDAIRWGNAARFFGLPVTS
jgi:hypothetical protein